MIWSASLRNVIEHTHRLLSCITAAMAVELNRFSQIEAMELLEEHNQVLGKEGEQTEIVETAEAGEVGEVVAVAGVARAVRIVRAVKAVKAMGSAGVV